MKTIVNRVLGGANLIFEELSTVLTRAEAGLNSRPITVLSSDPSDPTTLTPGHFLIEDSLMAVPEPDIIDIVTESDITDRLARWRRVTQYSQHLWQWWCREYLGQLQEQSKWASDKGKKGETRYCYSDKGRKSSVTTMAIGRGHKCSKRRRRNNTVNTGKNSRR